MKTNVAIFNLLTVFYIIVAAVYGYWSNLVYGEIEVIGFAAIGMLVFLTGFIAFYLGKTAKSFTGPEDLPDANIEDGEAEMGFFAPWSWWPIMLGIGGALCFTSLAIGWWIFIIGFPLAIVALIGFVFEHSRGLHAH
ncbi:MAG: cytochrome c oxidase subunit 4 [Micrococcales bacterium]|nr:cytochrome c oxidase subunit 4 [Microbacteriaceae bacterium]NBR22709.1 cytochrome c oxidase subunit 4 [Micrococcales bacterium]NBX94361.1 cytochrome c oxidase subunit 4 [Actinomycetota bacterium]NBR78099.1 cytochrome c oxidase subunit 4 [Microbacteriaceae bacterium]NBS60763.1 cytochrome c oxidase subunit 4 [Microbacteriaceae bacterium]